MNTSLKDCIIRGSAAGEKMVFNIPPGRFSGSRGISTGYSAGNSLEFMEHRDYFPGDDLRSIDWNVYARTDRLAVKVFHNEVTPALDIVIDTSGSMNHSGTPKGGAAAGLAAMLASAAGNSSYRYKIRLCGEHGFDLLEMGAEVPSLWGEFEFGGYFSPADVLEQYMSPFPAHGVRVFISDLLFCSEPGRFLSLFSAGASAVIILQVLALEDINPSLRGNIQLTDSETGESIEVFADSSLLKEYRRRVEAHCQAWYSASKDAGVFFTTAVAEDFSGKWLGLKEFESAASSSEMNGGSFVSSAGCAVEELVRKEVLRIL
jgi:hypothetical protein